MNVVCLYWASIMKKHDLVRNFLTKRLIVKKSQRATWLFRNAEFSVFVSNRMLSLDNKEKRQK